jgi:aminoglycoside 2'-N-acetyltransferase I
MDVQGAQLTTARSTRVAGKGGRGRRGRRAKGWRAMQAPGEKVPQPGPTASSARDLDDSGSLEIQVRASADLSAQARDEIFALCDRAYGEDLRPAFDAFVEPAHVLAVVEGTIVSHALWVTRWLAPRGSAPLRTAYVEAVATDPVYERRGFASAVMRTLVGRVADFQLAALCPSDRGLGLYSRLGWEHWIGPLSIRQGTGVIETPEESVMIYRLPLSPPLDLTQPLSAEWRPGELW